MQKTQIIFLVFLFVAATTKSMVDSQPSTEAKVYIVHTENPEDQEPEEYHIKTLASVLGSEDAAKEALIYSYKHAASGFSAKLTPEQVSELSIKSSVVKGDRLLANGERRGEATLHHLLALWRSDLQKATPWRQRREGTKARKASPFVFS